MKTYIGSFGWNPGCEEAVVFNAEDMDDARAFLSSTRKTIVFVDQDSNDDENECFIEEVDTTVRGVIYSGSYCC